MVDPQDVDPVGSFVDRAEDPVRASSSAVDTVKLPLERLADPPGFARKVAEGELDDRGKDSRRDALQVPTRGGSEDHLVPHRL